MAKGEEAQDQLLRSFRERVTITRTAVAEMRESLRASRQAISASHARIASSDQTIKELRNLADSYLGHEEAHPSAAAHANLMQLVSGVTLQNQVVSMDGKHFQNCNIVNCTLRYSGQPVIVETTSFSGCRFEFHGEAGLTIRFLECFDILEEQKVDYAVISASEPNHFLN